VKSDDVTTKVRSVADDEDGYVPGVTALGGKGDPLNTSIAGHVAHLAQVVVRVVGDDVMHGALRSSGSKNLAL
jgi:hypothetical protein